MIKKKKTVSFHFFCHFIRLVYSPLFDWPNSAYACEFHCQMFLICLIIVSFPHKFEILCLVLKKNVFFFFNVYHSTDSKPACSFFCLFHHVFMHLINTCVQCVCVCVYVCEHVSFLFSPLSQSSLDHTEFKRCGPFDPYINAKVCTHDL